MLAVTAAAGGIVISHGIDPASAQAAKRIEQLDPALAWISTAHN